MRTTPSKFIVTACLTTALVTNLMQAGSVGRVNHADLAKPAYTLEGDAFVRHNSERFNNRPLYCNQISAIVVAGDRPLIRYGSGSSHHGNFMLALARGQQAKWLHDCSEITSKYRPGRMEWIIKDAAFGDTTLILEAVPPAEGAGMAARLRVEHAQPGDRLIWACGGAVQLAREAMVNYWDVTTAGREKMLSRSFQPEDCRTNQVTLANGRFTLQTPPGKRMGISVGSCSASGKLTVADAANWQSPLALAASTAKELPMVCGVISLDKPSEICWAFQGFEGAKVGDTSAMTSPADFFAAGLKRAKDIGERVVVNTPDPWLNAAVGASSTVTDGVYRKGIFTHAGMRWGVPLLGWRCIYGGTAYGWHDRVKAQAQFCLAKQITESKKTQAVGDPKCGLACQSLDSRLFGKGRVDAHHTWHYDMQSQFFDQLIHAWRWTGDAELEKILRPALELHLEYIRDCFDPDDDGLYESYANTWPTDNQWYNGGGTAEETAYAYAGHKAALELARRAGDTAAVTRHEARLAKIKKSFFDKLWIPAKGHAGAFVEQGGLQRLHEECWLYSIFCPIDAGLLPPDLAAQSLYFTEWGLEREQMPYGGERVWPSNWVPSIWSLREMWPGDDYHLALAYFQTGLADEGWSVLRGTFPLLMFFGPVPGDLGHPAGATDFNDDASMFCRTVVEGLFGYRPDYPNGTVTIAPQFPSTWDHASIKTPDFSLDFSGGKYRVTLAKPAALDLRLPVRAKNVTAVTVNGQPAEWNLGPAFGRSELRVRVPVSKTASVEVTVAEPLPQFAAVPLEVVAGANPHPPVGDAKLTYYATFPTNAGNHLVDALVQFGKTPQWRLFKVKVSDPKADAARAAKVLTNVPPNARWEPVNLEGRFNADVRTMFQQQYLSPRPPTCSLRLATDGYSTWQMMLDPKHKTPAIDFSQTPQLLNPQGRLLTPQGVPFQWRGDQQNILFTSQWDNWPKQATVPVGRQADAVWFLVGGFTPPMQVRIANAVLKLKYADGVVEPLELVPPFNFWSLCPYGGVDYNYARDRYSLPQDPPPTVQLGRNCRMMVLNLRLRPNVALESVTLETLSQEVMVGLMGMTLMNPR
ncbi:MAG: DUF4450 domain-containing protein [Verrucomicrobiota bacterium]